MSFDVRMIIFCSYPSIHQHRLIEKDPNVRKTYLQTRMSLTPFSSDAFGRLRVRKEVQQSP